MRINKVWAVSFSPNGNTKKITMTIANYISDLLNAKLEFLDYTLPHKRESEYAFSHEDLIVWGSPVYASRLPNKMMPFIANNFEGNHAQAIPIVVFGNRSYGDALVELRNTLEANHFHTIGAGAFVAEHAFSKDIAPTRPDLIDEMMIKQFAKDIAHKVITMTAIEGKVSVPGRNPPGEYYKPIGLDGEEKHFLKAQPVTDITKCKMCGLCSKLCPMGSIDLSNPSKMIGICIKCHSCINNCLNEARIISDKGFVSHKNHLIHNYKKRQPSSVFL